MEGKNRKKKLFKMKHNMTVQHTILFHKNLLISLVVILFFFHFFFISKTLLNSIFFYFRVDVTFVSKLKTEWDKKYKIESLFLLRDMFFIVQECYAFFGLITIIILITYIFNSYFFSSSPFASLVHHQLWSEKIWLSKFLCFFW